MKLIIPVRFLIAAPWQTLCHEMVQASKRHVPVLMAVLLDARAFGKLYRAKPFTVCWHAQDNPSEGGNLCDHYCPVHNVHCTCWMPPTHAHTRTHIYTIRYSLCTGLFKRISGLKKFCYSCNLNRQFGVSKLSEQHHPAEFRIDGTQHALFQDYLTTVLPAPNRPSTCFP